MYEKNRPKMEKPSKVTGVKYLDYDLQEVQSLIHHINCSLLGMYAVMLRAEEDGQGGIRIRPVEVRFKGAIEGSADMHGTVYYVQDLDSAEIPEEVTDAKQ